MFCLSGEAQAATRELGQSELRQATASGDTISLKRVIDGAAKIVGGTPVDARAFESGDIFYRILVKKPNGRIVSVIVNARTGKSVSKNSSIGRQISAAAKSSTTKSKTGTGKSGRGNNNAGGKGKGGGNGGGKK